jgi:hypothetical protein
MRERVSGLQGSDRYFFRSDFEYVLRGIAFEYTPGGLYIWDFRFPLFEFFGLNLSYSDRLYERSGYIKKGEMSEEDIVGFIMSSPEARGAFGSDKPETMLDFIRFVDFKPSVLAGSTSARLTYASALLLSGQDSRAAIMLDELQNNPAMTKHDVVNCTLLRTKLRQGPAEVRALLDQVRRVNLRELGVAIGDDDNAPIEWARWVVKNGALTQTGPFGV